MSPRGRSEQSAFERTPTEEEFERGVGEFADMLLAESQPRMRQFFLAAVTHTDLAESVARQYGFKETQNWYKSAEAKKFREALEKRDRPALIALLKSGSRKDRMNQKDLESLLRLPDTLSSAFREGLLELAKKMFPGKPGPTPKAKRWEYPIMAQLGDRLASVCEIVLAELWEQTKHTVKEILDFQAVDHPTEAAFLLKHLARFESALEDKDLASRAKGLKPRARLIADAMAGAEFGFELRTSLERAREGRRMLKKSLS